MDLIVPSQGLILWQLIMVAYLGFWMYALIDCLKNEFRGPNQKLIWVLLILFAPIMGTFLYLSMSQCSKVKRKFDPDFMRLKNDKTT